MKKIICLFLSLLLVLSLTSCEKEKEDPDEISMFITMGNGEQYYRALTEMLEEDLGIRIKWVYQQNNNTSDYIKTRFAHNDLPADIVFTSSKTDNALLKDSCVDLMSVSSVTALFTQTTLQECTTEDGAIYQLPVSSKLIGITYNETLMQEMGWEVPDTFEDMLDLKKKCDEAGIKFAVSDGIATGHGFNWLFHLMGSEWLSTPEGTDWFEGFQNGTRSVDEFKEKCDYFRRWTEAGLWGSVHTADWGGSKEFSETRALFWFGLTNSVSGYQGMQYDDEGNETGIELNDTYKSMPWISEDGTNNCYTYYDNCWVYLNKALESKKNSKKLENALKVVEYLTGEKATALVSGISSDTYVSVNNYEMGDDRIYAAYNEDIKSGYVQPWYYVDFDSDSINQTGAVINAYIQGTASFDEIFTTLDKYNEQALNNEIEAIADFPEGLGYEDTAKLVALSAVSAVDQMLEKKGSEEQAEVALIAYTPGENELPAWKHACVCNSFIYEGPLDIAAANLIFAPGTNVPTAIRMTGKEIKELTEKGFDPSDRYIDGETGESTFDAENYGPYPYVCLVKGNKTLDDDKEYLVALCDKNLTLEAYNAFLEAGKVLTFETAVTLDTGLKAFCAEHPTITPKDLQWE